MNKTVLITGANTGFGFVTARTLSAQGHQVVMVCRNLERGTAAQERIFAATGQRPGLLLADLSLQSDVKRAASQFREQYDRLDVLVNNAGYAWSKRELTSEGFERTFALNYLAYFTLTLELVAMLVASAPARIVNTTSEAHRWEDIAMDNLQGERRFSKRFSPLPLMYGYSNMMRIMLTYELAERLGNHGVIANTFCPGFVPVQRSGQSNMMNGLSKLISRSSKVRTPEIAARMMVYLATGPAAAELNGSYHQSDMLMSSAEQTYDSNIRKQLWDETLRLTGYAVDPISQLAVKS